PIRARTWRDNAAPRDGLTVRLEESVRRLAVASRPKLASNETAPRQISQPRQPIHEPTPAARGPPTTSVRDCPLITQPRARPRWRSGTRAETSVNTTPVYAPAQPPPAVAHTATQENDPAMACAPVVRASTTREPASTGRRPTISD